MKIYEIVKNEYFGNGIIISNETEYKTIFFESGDIKKILSEFVQSSSEKFRYYPFEGISLNQLLSRIIEIMQNVNAKEINYDDLVESLFSEFQFKPKNEVNLKKLLSESEFITLRKVFELQSALNEKKLSINHENLNDKQTYYEIYAELSSKEFLTKKQIEETAKKHKVNFDNSMILIFLINGFKLFKKNYLLHKKWSDPLSFLENLSCSSEIYYYDNLIDDSYYDRLLNSLEEDLVIIKVTENAYVTKKKMHNLNIQEEDLNIIRKRLSDLFRNNFFVTRQSLIRFYEYSKLSQLGLDDEQFVILSKKLNKSMNTLNFSNNTEIYYSSENKIHRVQVIKSIVKEREIIHIYDLHDYLLNDFGIDYNIKSIIYDIENTSYYYSSDTETIYLSKHTFYKEVENYVSKKI
jgi:hypothetical protein